ncbi:hypothetical protein BU15DRAFT_79733 [Melanogaster broomeanus]|nr:hypothetical protein BU15DRAFT_79733 [Melanogaster broomeanus]
MLHFLLWIQPLYRLLGITCRCTDWTPSRDPSFLTLAPLFPLQISTSISTVSAYTQFSLDLSSTELPPKSEHFDIQSDWTQYYYRPDGSSYSQHVDYPHRGVKAEDMLVFDVETMPLTLPPVRHHDMRCLGERVSYPARRARYRESDTMLHVAIKGVSSHQRPPWTKHRKAKAEQVEQRVEAMEAVLEIMRGAESQEENEVDAAKRAKLRRLCAKLEESLPTLQEDDSDANDAELSNKRWEDLSSANSLADVAKLYCNIDMDKETRGDFMKASREDIRADIYNYLNYCVHDVYVTPGILTSPPSVPRAMPEPCLSWEDYLRNAERTYQELEMKVKKHLAGLAEEAKEIMEGGKSWGVYVDGQVSEPTPKVMSNTIKSAEPVWLRDIIKNGAFSPLA